MALTSSDLIARFKIYPIAPARKASCIMPLSSCTVRIRIFASGTSCLIRRVASIPPESGILISIRTISGFFSTVRETTLCSSSASPTTTIPVSAFSSATSPARSSPWSSATSNRIGISDLQHNGCTLPRLALDHQRRADHLRSLPNPKQTEVIFCGDSLGVEPHTVILHQHDQLVIAHHHD